MTASTDLKHYLVQQCALFRGLTPEQQADVAARSLGRHVERKGVLFSEGEAATVFHLLYAGRVKLTQLDASGQEQMVRLVSPGQFCGWLGQPATDAHPATARAIEASDTLAWDKRNLDALFERFPAISRNALRIQARRLREREERYRELATLKVPERLARTLLRLVCPAGRRFEDRILDDVPLSRADLAQLTGTTLFTVSRLISEWESRGIVKARRESVQVEDLRGLAGLTGDGELVSPPRGI